MRMPRFRIRTTMVAVAVVALLIAGERLRRHWRALAAGYNSHAAMLRLAATAWEIDADQVTENAKMHKVFPDWPAFSPEGTPAEEAARFKHSTDMAAHYEALQRKYERAARYPWLPVEPDPPDPPEPK